MTAPVDRRPPCGYGHDEHVTPEQHGRCTHIVSITVAGRAEPWEVWACERHATKVASYQSSQGHATAVAAATAEQIAAYVPNCVVAWGSHGCGLDADHDGRHVCAPGIPGCDGNRPDDELYAMWPAAGPLTPTGGVWPAWAFR